MSRWFRSSPFSPFSSVDSSDDPAALVAYLAITADGLGAMKRYMAAAAGRAVPGGLVVDVGCGAGHDLALLGAAGLRPVGVDASGTMLAASRRTAPSAPLVRAGGERLPFRSASVDGCRIERVLQHVRSPEHVMAEVARVLRPGGVLAAFEPDWASLAFGPRAAPQSTRSPERGPDPALDRHDERAAEDDADDEHVARGLVAVRSPDVGERLVGLVEAHGLRVVDRVTELSFGYAVADHPLRLEAALAGAVDRGRVDPTVAARWWARQRRLHANGRFRASWAKVLVVAHRR
jgi:SAM-dependent methyltransferase